MFHFLLPNLKLTAISHLKSWVELLDVALRHVTPEGEVKGLHADGSKIRDRIQALEILWNFKVGAWRHIFSNHISQGKPKEMHRNTKILGAWWGDSRFFFERNVAFNWRQHFAGRNLAKHVRFVVWCQWTIIPTCGAGLGLAVWSNSSLRKRRQKSNERNFLPHYTMNQTCHMNIQDTKKIYTLVYLYTHTAHIHTRHE